MRFISLLSLVVALGGCALFQQVPTQSLDCLEAQGSDAVADASIAATNAIAGNETTADIEAAAGNLTAAFLECEAQALVGDANALNNAANTAGVDVPTVRAHARSYLQAKGVVLITPRG